MPFIDGTVSEPLREFAHSVMITSWSFSTSESSPAVRHLLNGAPNSLIDWFMPDLFETTCSEAHRTWRRRTHLYLRVFLAVCDSALSCYKGLRVALASCTNAEHVLTVICTVHLIGSMLTMRFLPIRNMPTKTMTAFWTRHSVTSVCIKEIPLLFDWNNILV